MPLVSAPLPARLLAFRTTLIVSTHSSKSGRSPNRAVRGWRGVLASIRSPARLHGDSLPATAVQSPAPGSVRDTRLDRGHDVGSCSGGSGGEWIRVALQRAERRAGGE